MNNPTMLYKHPGKHEIHGDKFDYIIVDEEDIESAIADGWFRTTDEAKSFDSKLLRIDLERKAFELGIKFDGRTSDKKLENLIAAEMGE